LDITSKKDGKVTGTDALSWPPTEEPHVSTKATDSKGKKISMTAAYDKQ